MTLPSHVEGGRFRVTRAPSLHLASIRAYFSRFRNWKAYSREGNVTMYFSERSDLQQPQCQESKDHHTLSSNAPQSLEFAGRSTTNNCRRPSLRPAAELGAKDVLNTANNRLQELMQLLYLLSRDPGVPSDARYHVTMAQSEIALLVRIMRNAEEAHDNATRLPAAAAMPSNL